ncbi:hypothetical protein ACPWT1_10890 [Ramlibacter sp. MMS24-I3-19]|uniref:hypothetical protein n=1 Tax=Ramlibacter sp. MMS24-I3-19 TaxID=3416606 RepID=UPI003CFE4746
MARGQAGRSHQGEDERAAGHYFEVEEPELEPVPELLGDELELPVEPLPVELPVEPVDEPMLPELLGELLLEPPLLPPLAPIEPVLLPELPEAAEPVPPSPAPLLQAVRDRAAAATKASAAPRVSLEAFIWDSLVYA